jgi:lipoate---protein ligase
MTAQLHFLSLEGLSIFQQLQLEEALLRADDRNWCLINRGVAPAIVLGMTANLPLVVDLKRWEKEPIPLIRRFSGGGTVLVDEETLFVTFIFQREAVPIELFPRSILDWTGSFYRQALGKSSFCIRENDYVFQDKKCGGNAQYLRKDRWLHHTSFLWNFCHAKMDYLLFPPKTPLYRKERLHSDFLTPLKEHFPYREWLFEKVKTALCNLFDLQVASLETVSSLLDGSYRRSTTLL